jgi:hypothetical protein
MSGRKQPIELFGDYWHTLKARETLEQRISHFGQYGFEKLILWEGELGDERQVLEKIREF